MPVEVSSQADVAYQDELWIGPFNGGTVVTNWTQVLGLQDLNQPVKTPEKIDATHMQSPGRTRENIVGLLPVGEMSQELQHWPRDPGQILLDQLATLTETGQGENILIEMVSGGVRRTYRAQIDSFSIAGSVGAKRMVTVAADLFDRQPTNVRSVL